MTNPDPHDETSGGCTFCTLLLYFLFPLLVLWLTSGYAKSALKAFRRMFMARCLFRFAMKCDVVTTTHKQQLFLPLKEMAEKAKERGGAPLKLVEIGAGTGANFKYFPEGIEVTCVEPNDRCEPYLRRTVAESGGHVTLAPTRVCGAEVLTQSGGFQENSVDAVVCTLVLCSVRDVELVLQEVIKILKPGGKFFFLEHIIAEPNTRAYTMQRYVRPVYRALFDCTINSNTHELIGRAGFTNVKLEMIMLEEFKTLLPWVLAPMVSLIKRHVIGTATK